MKPQNKESMHSIDKKTESYLDDVREVSFLSSYPIMLRWARRVKKQPDGVNIKSISRLPRVSSPYKWGVVALLLFFVAGFIPLRNLDVLGYLMHAEVEGDIVTAREYLAALDVPHEQVEFVRLSGEERTHVVLFLPSYTEEEIEPVIEAINNDSRVLLEEAQRIEEEINRSTYDAFFSSLPASLTLFYSKERMDLLRYNRLTNPIVQDWLNTDEVSYHTGYSVSGDTLRFSIIAGGGTPIPTEREALFEEYDRIDRAIRLLKDEEPRVVGAREALMAHRDSLEALISGARR